MSHVPHELAEEFPGKGDRITELKKSSPHFTRLIEQYHDINRAVHRAETNVEPTDEAHEQDLRKQRLALKDEIAEILSSAEAG